MDTYYILKVVYSLYLEKYFLSKWILKCLYKIYINP